MVAFLERDVASLRECVAEAGRRLEQAIRDFLKTYPPGPWLDRAREAFAALKSGKDGHAADLFRGAVRLRVEQYARRGRALRPAAEHDQRARQGARREGDGAAGVKGGAIPMRFALCVTLFVLSVSAAGEALAITGNYWMGLGEPEQLLYVAGVMDAWQNVGTAFTVLRRKPEPPASQYVHVYDCAVARGMTNGQVAAIVRKYMEENPASWH